MEKKSNEKLLESFSVLVALYTENFIREYFEVELQVEFSWHDSLKSFNENKLKFQGKVFLIFI